MILNFVTQQHSIARAIGDRLEIEILPGQEVPEVRFLPHEDNSENLSGFFLVTTQQVEEQTQLLRSSFDTLNDDDRQLFVELYEDCRSRGLIPVIYTVP